MARWQRTLYIMFFVHFMSAVGMSSIFPFLPLYVEHLGSSTGMSVEFLAGLVFSAQAFAMMIASPVWGALADQHGRKMMVERATFGAALTILLMAFARSAEELVALRALQGLVSGVMSAGTALVVADVPRDRIGYAMGLLQMGTWSGIAIGPMIGGIVSDTLGFRAAFIVTASLLALAGLLVWIGITEQFKPPPRQAGVSRRAGFLAGYRHVLAQPGVTPTYATRFICWLGRAMPMPFMPLFIAALLPAGARVATWTGVTVGVASFAGTVGAVYLGRLGDRTGHRRILIASALAAALFYVPQVWVTQVWQLLILQALVGAAAGGILPAVSALLARYTQPGEEGTVYGLENSIVAASRAAAPMLGSVFVVWFGLRSIFALTGLAFFIAALVAVRWLPDPRAVPESRPASVDPS